MAVYNITLSDGVTVVSIGDGSVDLTSADIPLVGQNSQLYGDDIAKAQLFMLENFANSSAPSINPIKGQLWFDTTAGSETLKVRNTSGAWVPMAPFTLGTVDSAMPRWNDATKSWIEETQLQLSTAGVLSVFDAGLTNSVTIAHDGTWLNFDIGAGTTDAVRIRNTDLFIMDGGRLSWMPGGPQQFEICHDGTDVNFQFVAGGELLITQPTNVRINSVIALQDKASPPSDVPGYGQLWVRNDTPNILVFTDDTGTDFDLNAVGGAADHGGLTGLGDDDHTQYAEIANTETILSIWTYTARPAFNSAGAPFTVANTTVVTNLNADLLDGNSASAFALASATVNLTGNQSPAGVKTFTDILKVNTGVGGAGQGVRVLGLTSSDSSNSGFFSIYHQDEGQEQGRFGTNAGTAAIEVRALTANLDLYASNVLKLRLNATESFLQISPGIDAMRWHQAGISGTDVTSASVFDDGGGEFNVGYNETAEIIVAAPRTIGIIDIGKFLRRSASTSRVITINNDSAIPVGGSAMVHNDHTTGTLTIVEGSATLEWVDGSGVAPLTGTRTIAYNGVVTIRKKSSTVWQIWGNGIS